MARSDARHLEAVLMEQQGMVLPNSNPGGHIREVASARSGLYRALDDLRNALKAPGWDAAAQRYLREQELLIEQRIGQINAVLTQP